MSLKIKQTRVGEIASVSYHYTPTEDTSAAIIATGGSSKDINGTSGKLSVVTGIKRDSKGHIVGVTSTNIYSSGSSDGGVGNTGATCNCELVGEYDTTGLVKNGSTITTITSDIGYVPCPIVDGVPYYQNTKDTTGVKTDLSSKLYLIGTRTSNSDVSETYRNTNVYANGSKLHANTFVGSLSGTADKATNDSDGNKITTTYTRKFDFDEFVAYVDSTFSTTDTNVTNNSTTSTYYLCGSTTSGNTTGTLVKRSDVYVDTSGNLNAKSFYVHASAKITSDASYNMFFNVNGESPLVIVNDKSSNMFVAPGSSYSNKYSLGTSSRLWSSVHASKFVGKLEGNASTATTATSLSVSGAVGSTTKPVYITASGRPVACSFTVSKSVPSYAAFTDTKNTAGTTTANTTKLFLVGGAEVAANTQTYTNSNCYIGTDNCLYSGGKKVSTTDTKNTVGAYTTKSKLYFIGTTTSTSADSQQSYKNVSVYVSGTALYAAGGFYETSDERLKDFSNKIDVDLDKISKIKKHRFTWKGSENKNEEIGVSAQEIKELYPEIVSENEEGYLSVAYDKLAVVALAAIDELHKKNKELEARIELLESKLLN